MNSFSEILTNGIMNMDGDLRGIFQGILNTQIVEGKMGWNPMIDMVDSKDFLHLYVEAPGVCKDSFDINVHGSKLYISGEKVRNYDGRASKKEIIYGKFNRCINLPIVVSNGKNIIVNYKRGVLIIIIDKRIEEDNKFKIEIKNSSDSEN